MLQLYIMLYHQTKSGCKRISHIFLIIRHHCDLDLDNTPLFSTTAIVFSLSDTLAHDDAPTYPVWLQMVQRFRRYDINLTYSRHASKVTDTETDTVIYIHIYINICPTLLPGDIYIYIYIYIYNIILTMLT